MYPALSEQKQSILDGGFNSSHIKPVTAAEESSDIQISNRIVEVGEEIPNLKDVPLSKNKITKEDLEKVNEEFKTLQSARNTLLQDNSEHTQGLTESLREELVVKIDEYLAKEYSFRIETAMENTKKENAKLVMSDCLVNVNRRFAVMLNGFNEDNLRRITDFNNLGRLLSVANPGIPNTIETRSNYIKNGNIAKDLFDVCAIPSKSPQILDALFQADLESNFLETDNQIRAFIAKFDKYTTESAGINKETFNTMIPFREVAHMRDFSEKTETITELLLIGFSSIAYNTAKEIAQGSGTKVDEVTLEYVNTVIHELKNKLISGK